MLRAIVLLSAFSYTALSAQTQMPVPAALELKNLDLRDWDCLDKPEGVAKTEDGKERNLQKNRSPVDLAGRNIPSFDFAAFLDRVGNYDREIGAKRRRDLAPGQKEQLQTFEKQIVSLTGWLVMAYPSWPPETTNCKSDEIRDWHLELRAEPSDHPPQIGDPTAIVCEITPRTESSIYRSDIRIQNVAAFVRLPDNKPKATTGGKAHKIRVTGYLLWDDEHNGANDIGATVQRFSPNGYHKPWRLTAWEIHPVFKIEDLGTSDQLAGQRWSIGLLNCRMVGPAKIYFIIFGLLTIAGGIIGYVKAGSMPSIIAGSITGILLLVGAWLLPEHTTAGLLTVLIVSLVLAAQFVPKFIKTGKAMPAGMMSILSVIGIIVAIVAWVRK